MEDRGQRTEDRGWRTEDRGRRTEETYHVTLTAPATASHWLHVSLVDEAELSVTK